MEDDPPRAIISLFRHPLAAVGSVMMVAGLIALLLLVVQDLTASDQNPYRLLVTYIAMPGVITLGFVVFLISLRVQVVAARKRGEQARFVFRFEPTDERYMRNLWIFLGLSAVGFVVVGFFGFRAYEATESSAFCGEVCHVPMEPEAVSHPESAHARVECAECHIGSGVKPYVEAKLAGLRQLWGALTNGYDRPVATPIEMRDAEHICEECHWRDASEGTKVLSHTYYSLDDASSPWTINLMLNLGVGQPRSDQPSGVHWHTSSGNAIEYIARDHELQDIIWVRVTDAAGDTREYVSPGIRVPSLADPDTEVQHFDCLDCHNRPAHVLEPASRSINEALFDGRIPDELPEIKDIAMEVLLDDYEDRDAAHAAIPDGLESFFEANYPDATVEAAEAIQQAARALIDIYDVNFFPEMKTDYRVRQYNDGHLSWDGCFRCHDGEKADQYGNVISNDCNVCHLIVGQGPGEGGLPTELDSTGLEFEHPFDVPKWRDRSCVSCHEKLDDL